MIATTAVPATSRASELDLFLHGAVASYRARLAQASDEGERALIEGALTLLTDHRVSGIDTAGFEALLARMARGRSPVTLIHTTPRSVAADVSARLRAYRSVVARISHD
jgi:hypothetical protein